MAHLLAAASTTRPKPEHSNLLNPLVVVHKEVKPTTTKEKTNTAKNLNSNPNQIHHQQN